MRIVPRETLIDTVFNALPLNEWAPIQLHAGMLRMYSAANVLLAEMPYTPSLAKDGRMPIQEWGTTKATGIMERWELVRADGTPMVRGTDRDIVMNSPVMVVGQPINITGWISA